MTDNTVDLPELTPEQVKEIARREGLIPRERFNEETDRLKSQNAQLQQQFSTLENTVKSIQQAPPASPQEKPKFTRAQLRAYVDDEKITQEEADTIWDNQVAEQQAAREKALEEKLTSQIQQSTQQQNLQSRIDAYTDLMPDILKDGSEDRTKLEGVYNDLAQTFGYPEKGSDQELKMYIQALKQTFGTIDVVRERLTKHPDSRDTMRDQSDATKDKHRADDGQTKEFKALTPEKRAHYSHLVDKGVMNWDDVQEEITWQRKKK